MGRIAKYKKQDFLYIITQGKMSSKDYPNMLKAEQMELAYQNDMVPEPIKNPRGETLSRAIPENDDCSNAIEVYIGSNVNGSTVMATGDAFVYDYITGMAPGVWYEFQGNGQRVTFSLCGTNSDYNARLSIFEGSCGNMEFLGTNNLHCVGNSGALLPEATINAKWGETYYIYVSGYRYTSDTGYFEINVTGGNFCDITGIFPPYAECGENGTYWVSGDIYGNYFPLNGDLKVVIGGETYRITQTNFDESFNWDENYISLEYTYNNNSDLYLPWVDKFGSNMDFFVQADQGCTWTLRNDFDAPDCSCPEGDVILESQQDVNNFRANYPDCTEIEGRLFFRGNSITDLSPMANIRTVNGDLVIYQCENLRNTNGLSNVQTINGDIAIVENDKLEDIDDLFRVDELGSDLYIIRNPRLENLDGLSNLRNVEGLVEIAGNNNLRNLEGLRRVETINDNYLMIRDNTSLSSLEGLSDLKFIDGFLLIFSNHLETIDGLENLETITRGVVIQNNSSLRNLDGLRGLERVDLSVGLYNNQQLTDFDGLCPLYSNGYAGDLYQSGNGAIFNPEEDCYDPQNCDITGVIDYGTTCTGSSRYTLSVDFTGHDLPQNGLLEKVVVAGQSFYNVAYYNLDPGVYTFYLYNLQSNNRDNVDVFFAAVNGECTWTVQDLYDEPSCSSSRLGREGEIEFSVFPNPSKGQFTVITDGIERPEIHVLNQLGQVIYKSKVDRGIEHRISLANAQAGVYFVRVIGENYSETQKLMLNK